jgi:hypothetical protein
MNEHNPSRSGHADKQERPTERFSSFESISGDESDAGPHKNEPGDQKAAGNIEHGRPLS